MTQPATTHLQVIWQVTGDWVELLERLNLDRYEQDPSLDVHAGEGTLDQARQEGSDLQLIRNPKGAPDPLIAFAAVDVFTQADIFGNDAPCLIVGPTFIVEFNDEVQTSCHELTVKVVMYGSTDILDMNRSELLKRVRPDVTLYALIPLTTIKTRRPIKQDRRIYVPAEEQLPPFFRVPWNKSSVFVRDDIRERIESKMRGAQFNLTALMP